MHLGSLRRRAMAIAGGVAMVLAAAGPNVAAAAGPPPPPPTHIDAFISDTGFDKTTYNVTGTFLTVIGDITFHNTGSVVHSATIAPGSAGSVDANIEAKYDANGNETFACWRTGKFGPNVNVPGVGNLATIAAGCTKYSAVDTGGIGPGQAVTIGFDRTNATGTNSFQITSAPDCLSSPKSTTFNCTPVTINVSSGAGIWAGGTISKLGPLNGNLLGQVTDPNCAPQGKVYPNTVGAAPFCYLTTAFQNSTSKGSPATPLTGNITVTIDDYNGFQPTNVTIAAGSTVTWVNKGSRTRGVAYFSPVSLKGVNVVPANLGGIQPGQSASISFPCNYLANPANPCSWSYPYASLVELDHYPCSMQATGPVFGCLGFGTAVSGGVNIVPAPTQ